MAAGDESAGTLGHPPTPPAVALGVVAVLPRSDFRQPEEGETLLGFAPAPR